MRKTKRSRPGATAGEAGPRRQSSNLLLGSTAIEVLHKAGRPGADGAAPAEGGWAAVTGWAAVMGGAAVEQNAGAMPIRGAMPI